MACSTDIPRAHHAISLLPACQNVKLCHFCLPEKRLYCSAVAGGGGGGPAAEEAPAGAPGAGRPSAGSRRVTAEGGPPEGGRLGAAVASYAAALQELLAQLLLHWKVRAHPLCL